MTCPNKAKNRKNCNCNYDPCPRKGNCCECVAYHREQQGLPACLRQEPDDLFGPSGA